MFYHFTLSDQLSSIELSHNGFEDLVGDGRQHAIVVVQAQSGEDVRQGVRPAIFYDIILGFIW